MHWGCFGCVCRCRSSTRLALPWWWEWASLLFAPPHTNAVFYGHHPPGQGQGKTGSGVGNAQLSAVGIACSVGGRDTLMLGLGTATYSYTPCNTASFPVDFLQSTFPAQCVVEQGELANAKVLFINFLWPRKWNVNLMSLSSERIWSTFLNRSHKIELKFR